MNLMNFPIVVLILSFVVLFLAAQTGDLLRTKLRPLNAEDRTDFSVTTGATLTLLGLIIGFTFSMAVSRYDQRKDYEEAEANAIGTEYLRADLLPADNASKVRELLKKYIDQRVLFYTTRDEEKLAKINADTAKLQNELWSALRPQTAQPTILVALAISGMNDVLNSQGYTQAAWWNRIPIAAWGLMMLIAICCNLLMGFAAHRTDRRVLVILPIAISVAFFLICEIDSPHGGTIRVLPHNLISLDQALHSP
jgi:lipopolysaccharide export LptBFGC system permease protein LptF